MKLKSDLVMNEVLKDLEGVYNIIRYVGGCKAEVDFTNENKDSNFDKYFNIVVQTAAEVGGRYAMAEFKNILDIAIEAIEEGNIYDSDTFEIWLSESIDGYEGLLYYNEIKDWIQDCPKSFYYCDLVIESELYFKDFSQLINCAYYYMLEDLVGILGQFIYNNYNIYDREASNG